MSAQQDQQTIDNILRVLSGLGWEVVATDRSGPRLRVIIEHDKPASDPPPQTSSY